MGLFIKDIKYILKKIQNGTDISNSEFLQFHHINCAIIKSYLKTIRRSLVNIMMKLDYTFDDIVKICTERIYTGNSKNKFLHLYNFIEKYKEKLDTILDSELFLIYKGYLIHIADQELARQYATADPIGAKIHRNIVLSLKKIRKTKIV